jgi:3-oxoacyl-[acyl-carrier protein] reductase
MGADCAGLFANEGAMVVVSEIAAAMAADVAANIRARGGVALAVAGDLLKDDCVKELVAKAAAIGNGKIHIIVNNAGFTWDAVIHKAGPPVSPRTPDNRQHNIQTNTPPLR